MAILRLPAMRTLTLQVHLLAIYKLALVQLAINFLFEMRVLLYGIRLHWIRQQPSLPLFENSDIFPGYVSASATVTL